MGIKESFISIRHPQANPTETAEMIMFNVRRNSQWVTEKEVKYQTSLEKGNRNNKKKVEKYIIKVKSKMKVVKHLTKGI